MSTETETTTQHSDEWKKGAEEMQAAIMKRVRWMREEGETDLRGLIWGILSMPVEDAVTADDDEDEDDE
jgi:hypothetical protein